ncbi:MAG: GGDEF domain-containing protein [Magnetococcus sp. DMHC-1]
MEQVHAGQDPAGADPDRYRFFKPFNDHYGHAAGDECLKKVARVLVASMVRTIDFVARYGGEEFVCVLPETDAAGVHLVAQRLLENVVTLAHPHEQSKVAAHVTISLGGAVVIPSQEDSLQLFLRQADERLYKAKAGGRNRFVGQD